MEPVAETLQGLTLGASFRDRYARTDRIGVGGMGEVSLVSDNVIGRDIAMKVIRSELARDATTTARFLREARVQGQLEHPSIVPVYDLGVNPDGAAYFTMKRVNGFTLDSVIDALAKGDPGTIARFSRRRLLGAMVNVCLAVDFAHRRGVLHRDLKPSNIMLGDFGEVSVLDWGLAKLVGLAEESNATTPVARVSEPAVGSSAQTQAGQMLGTAGFMSPEQTRGEIDALDERTDVYSLGAILYEVLALQPLHAGDNLAEIVASTLGTPDARPSVVRPDVPPQLDDICVRATAGEANERYGSARDVANAIEAFLDAELALEMRHKLASDHVAAARRFLDDPSPKDSFGAARLSALRELGRALALDPTHADALRTVAEAIAAAPRALPADAGSQLDALAHEKRRHAMATLALRFVAWTLFFPLFVWMGVRQWAPLLVAFFCSLGAAAVAWWCSRQKCVTSAQQLTVFAFTLGTLGAASWMLGPFVVVPALAATNAMMFCMQTEPRDRTYVALGGIFAIVFPFLLEQLDLFPRAYRFANGIFEILPRAVDLPETATLTTLLVMSVATVLLPTRAIGSIRDALAAAERRVFVQAWQLQQLVPEATREAVVKRKR
jgi:serine/threonine-protein kinase